MASNNTQSPLSSASAFWVGAYALAFIPLLWIGVWSYFNNSIRGALISLIFLAMLVASAVISRRTLYQEGSFEQNSASFLLGFALWLFLGQNTNSVLSLTTNELFAAIASELPNMLQFVVNTFLVPIAEESLWMIAIPDVLAFLMDQASKSDLFGLDLAFFKNKVLQIIIISVVAATTFALFHVGNIGLAAFIFAAMLFRVAMIFFVIGDRDFNVVPGLNNLPAFAVGAHIGNNLASFGISDGVQLLNQSPSIGLIVYLVFGIILIAGLDELLGWARRLAAGDTSQ